MRKLMKGAAIAACLVIGVQAQDTKIQTKTETKVEDGKKVTLTGCLQSTAGKYSLANITGGKDTAMPATMMLGLPSEKPVDLQAHAGHRVEITGVMSKRSGDDLDVKTKTETKVETQGQPDAKVKGTSKAEIDTAGAPFVLVTGLKHISPTCQ